MKFKISLSQKPFHNGPATCVGWYNAEEAYSMGDDNQLVSWQVSTNQPTALAQMKDLFPTDMHFLPRTGGGVGKHGDMLLVTSADGKFHIINKTGRIERTVEGHKGAILVGQWSGDGSGLLTAGEDGQVKVWSKSGMLRSTVVSSDSSVYGACWSPDCQSVAYTHAKCVVIKPLSPNTKPLRWKAHEGLVLCLAWSPASELLVSGGEDCRYRVWDGQGRQMFSGPSHDNHITSISWSPAGHLFAVGGYNTLRLCDYSGWSRSLEKPATGTVYKMAWSGDGTQLAGACASGHVIIAHVVERHVHYINFSASVTEKKNVTVRNVADDTVEQLEFPERVIQLAMRYNNLVATTPSQCYIYNTNNWNTPVIFELKDGSVNLVILCEKHMILIEKATVGIYNYQGRLVSSPRWPNMRLDLLRTSHVSLSPDIMAVRDIGDQKTVHLIDISQNRSNETHSSVTHSIQITHLSLDQWGSAQQRTLAILDKSNDLYIMQVRGIDRSFSKLSRKIECFQWNSAFNSIAAIQDGKLIVWYCPTACFSPKLLHLCSFHYDAPELGRSPRISDFVGSNVSIRRADGSLLNVAISPFPELVHKYVQDNKWTDALSLCRNINNETVWCCLAVLATQSTYDAIDVAEEAFANINHHEKVLYIQYMKNCGTKAEQKSHMALLGGKFQEAESILLHNGMVFQAIYMNVKLHNWTKALDLAVKHKTHIDTVLYLRQKYLSTLGKSETNNKFSNLNDSVQIDPQKVEQKINMELQKRKQSI